MCCKQQLLLQTVSAHVTACLSTAHVITCLIAPYFRTGHSMSYFSTHHLMSQHVLSQHMSPDVTACFIAATCHSMSYQHVLVQNTQAFCSSKLVLVAPSAVFRNMAWRDDSGWGSQSWGSQSWGSQSWNWQPAEPRGRARGRQGKGHGRAKAEDTSSSGSQEPKTQPKLQRHEKHKYADEEVLRCPWPGPRMTTFAKKGEPGNWAEVADEAETLGLVRPSVFYKAVQTESNKRIFH